MSKSRPLTGYALIAAAAMIWGTLGISIRYLAAPVLAIAAYRALFTLIATGLVVAARRDPSRLNIRGQGRRLFILAVILLLNYVFFINAIRETTVANAALLTYLAPVFVAIMSPLILRERLQRITLFALTLSVIGIFTIYAPSALVLTSSSSVGLLYGLGSGLTYALLLVYSKMIANKLPMITILFYQFLFETILLLPALFIFEVPSGKDIAILIILAVIHNLVAGTLYLKGLRTVRAQAAGIIAYLDPLTAIIYAAVLFSEAPSALTMAGGAMIIAAGYMIVTRMDVDPETIPG